ncbi:hypothetical protein F2P81_019768 [Scophthalmus maximus]|uniref:Reverse transcriptase domain-containing protein n=1 Tax=Scophthalmus maximus TaxID=52904 RepID=A0A6A4S204_SCOMX|nr:hypothetical protein F2P81_019768 [Scophthalmus maximus]
MGFAELAGGSRSGGEGSSLAVGDVHRGSADVCTPALRALLGVAHSALHERMDEQSDKRRLHTAVCQPTPSIRRGAGDCDVVSGRGRGSDDRVVGALGERSHLQSSARPGVRGLLLPVLPGSEEDRRDETHSRPVSLQQIDYEEAVPHAHHKACLGMCALRRLVRIHRFERLVFPCPNRPQAQEIPAFLVQRSPVPIQPFPLDDLLVLASSEHSAALHTVELASHLTLLGFAIHWRKSSPVPTQCIMYLGVYLDSSSMRASLSPARREALASLLSRVTPGQTVTALSVMRLLGMMSAGHVVVPLGLLHMRKLQRWFSRLRLDPICQKMRLVTLPSSVQSDLTHWGNPRVLAAGVPLGRVTSHVSVFTDASLFGWGGMCQAQVIGGTWPEPPTHHINFLELSTVLKVLHHFAPLLRDQHVLVRTDNKTAAAYINRQGGVRSARLLETARSLLLWAHANLCSIRAVYIPGKQNQAADLMSRGGPRQSEWKLNPALVQMLWARFGEAEVDLFASHENAQCALWFSMSAQEEPPLGVDAFSHHPWPRALLYAFPPIPLIPRLLARVQEEQLSVILVAPERTSLERVGAGTDAGEKGILTRQLITMGCSLDLRINGFKHPENENIHLWRECVLKTLIVYLREDPDDLIKEYLPRELRAHLVIDERLKSATDDRLKKMSSPTEMFQVETLGNSPLLYHLVSVTTRCLQERDVHKLFKRQNPRKAAGPDSVSPSTLKHCADQLSPVITGILKHISLETCHVPACFKVSNIIPVPKKPRITGLNDYRPVALTSVIMKSFERLVLSHLKAITNPLLDPLQFAYRANRSVDAAVNMAHHFTQDPFCGFQLCLQHYPPGSATGQAPCAQLHLQVDHRLPFRKQRVKLGKHVSESQTISTGSPQGCVLPPLLFSLCTNGCNSSHQYVKLLKFADDTAVIGLISGGDESAYRSARQAYNYFGKTYKEYIMIRMGLYESAHLGLKFTEKAFLK